MQCNRCLLQYIGETKRRLKDRFNERRSVDKTNIQSKPTTVAEHFLSHPNHCHTDMQLILHEIIHSSRDSIRKARESFLKVPISSKSLFSYLILYRTQWTSAKEKLDLDRMQSFLEVLKTFKFSAILVHHSTSLPFFLNELWRRLRNMWPQAWLISLCLPL